MCALGPSTISDVTAEAEHAPMVVSRNSPGQSQLTPLNMLDITTIERERESGRSVLFNPSYLTGPCLTRKIGLESGELGGKA